MKTIEVDNWEEAKQALCTIEKEKLVLMEEHRWTDSSEFLFRGHGDANWLLSTTLDRATSTPLLLEEYYRHMLKTRPQIEAFSDNRWELMDLEKYSDWASTKTDLNWPDFPGYEFMIYLRHHGFPSPLLDWTMSFYVAAYFALKPIQQGAKKAAIYCYLDRIGPGKTWSTDQPNMVVQGPFARSHRRHFLQQCKYTICSELGENGLQYGSHEEVIARNNAVQDIVWKIEMPRSTANHALKDLDSMNINSLSLMGTEDALVETLAIREYFQNDA
jgi:hypothetical protein